MGNSISKKLKLERGSKSKLTILELPSEILAQIFSKLHQEDLLNNVALVCKTFYEVSCLYQTLPMIRIYCYEKSIENWKKNLEIGLKKYPTSKIQISLLEISNSQFKDFHCHVPLVQKMSIRLRFDSDDELPVFENLKRLRLSERTGHYDCNLCISVGFWQKFPNLTSLKIDYPNCRTYGAHVSFIEIWFEE